MLRCCLQRKPWTEMVDRNAFSRPANLAEVHLYAMYVHPQAATAAPYRHGPHGQHGVLLVSIGQKVVQCNRCGAAAVAQPGTACPASCAVTKSRPLLLAQALSRFKKNSAYFRINYFVFILLTTVVCMVMNPSSLVVLGLLGALWFYLFIVRQASITIGGRAFRCWSERCLVHHAVSVALSICSLWRLHLRAHKRSRC
jgi:PRA1 family protein